MFKVSVTFLIVIIVDLLATSGDLTATWTSPMFSKLNSTDPTINPMGRPITEDEDSWLASLLNIGAVCGALPIGFIADKIGRKYTLIILAVPHIIAYFIYAFANNIYLFYLGRIISGMSEGAGYAILPMYVAEVTDDSNRATLSVTLSIFWALGNFIPFAIGPYLPVRTFNLILACIPSLFLVLFLIFGTETPHYLMQIGKLSEAQDAIQHLRSCNSNEAAKEVDLLKERCQIEEDGSFLDILRVRGLRKALIISATLIILQQFSGINAILFYLEPIFEAAGTNISPSISSTISGACLFLSSFLIAFIVEPFGKKWPLGISCLGNGLSLFAIGAYFYIKEETSLNADSISWLPITGVLACIISFNIGFNSLPWTISSELFPNNVKGVAASTIAVLSWGGSFFITKSFDYFKDNLGKGPTFWLYGSFCIVTIIFDIIWLPETKGKTFREIQEILER